MTTPAPANNSSAFNKLATYFRQNKGEPVALGTAVLLGSTALATPLLSSTLGAMALMAGSFYLLVKSSDVVVEAARSLGIKAKIPKLLVGLGLGAVTSMPELAVSVKAALNGAAELGVGNIVGSNIANILLILGLTAAITPIASRGLSWRYNTLAMAGVTALYTAGMAYGSMGLAAGLGMLGLGAAYMAGSYKAEKDDEIAARARGDIAPEEAPPTGGVHDFPKWLNLGYGAAGVAGLIAAAGLLVTSATVSATALGIAPALVGTLAIAVGTSLPELAVNIKAALKGETEMAVGNVLGSNIFNILMVGGAVSLAGVHVPADFSPSTPYGLLNMGAFAASGGLLTYALLKGKGALSRAHGIVGLGLYAAFTAASFFMSTPPAETPAVPVEKSAIVETMPASREALVIQDYPKKLSPV